ncbi:hypothetical protein LguiA_022694 [Lonicera macranthoides]
MGAVMKLIDIVLFLFFLLIAVVAPLIDAQTCLPLDLFPPLLIDLKSKYASDYGDYLISDKPHFFVGIVWLEILFQWPLAVASLYGIAAGKSWVRTTSLVYGVSTFTAMVAILAELKGSGRASEKLLKIYYPFLGFAVLAILRGLLPHSGKTGYATKRPALSRKKKA